MDYLRSMAGSGNTNNNGSNHIEEQRRQFELFEKQRAANPRVDESQVNQIARNLADMGISNKISREQIINALRQNSNNTEQTVDYLMTNIQSQMVYSYQSEQQNDRSQTANVHYSPQVMDGYNTNQNDDQFEIYQKIQKQQLIPASERCRDPQLPSGLTNIGNTCYANSVFQTLFFLPNMQGKILNYQSENDDLLKIAQDKDLDNQDKIKLKQSKILLHELRKLYSAMLISNEKYQNPTLVLHSIVDDDAHKIVIHE